MFYQSPSARAFSFYTLSLHSPLPGLSITAKCSLTKKYLSLNPDTFAEHQTTHSASHLTLISSQTAQLHMSGTPGCPPNSSPSPQKVCSFSPLPHLSKWYLKPKSCISHSSQFLQYPPPTQSITRSSHLSTLLHSHCHHLNQPSNLSASRPVSTEQSP